MASTAADQPEAPATGLSKVARGLGASITVLVSIDLATAGCAPPSTNTKPERARPNGDTTGPWTGYITQGDERTLFQLFLAPSGNQVACIFTFVQPDTGKWWDQTEQLNGDHSAGHCTMRDRGNTLHFDGTFDFSGVGVFFGELTFSSPAYTPNEAAAPPASFSCTRGLALPPGSTASPSGGGTPVQQRALFRVQCLP